MEQESQKREAEETEFQTPNIPTLCANNCGFFGSPATNNLCSKCYKDYFLSKSKASNETLLVPPPVEAKKVEEKPAGGDGEAKVGGEDPGKGEEIEQLHCWDRNTIKRGVGRPAAERRVLKGRERERERERGVGEEGYHRWSRMVSSGRWGTGQWRVTISAHIPMFSRRNYQKGGEASTSNFPTLN